MPDENPNRGVRLQKILAEQGAGSRRELDRRITQGRVQLNGKTAQPGDRFNPGDRLMLDGKAVPTRGLARPLILGLMYHKPAGEVTTRSDERGRPIVFDSLPRCDHGRWINVGRLDFNTSGLLLLLNHGELVNRLAHPRYQIAREYAVRVRGRASDAQIDAMLAGVMLADGMARFERVVDAGGAGSNHWYHVCLREGRNREVRRIWESQGLPVSRLIRVRFGPLRLDPGLRAGACRPLRPAELNQLLNETGMPTLKAGGAKHAAAASRSTTTRGATKSTAKPGRPARRGRK